MAETTGAGELIAAAAREAHALAELTTGAVRKRLLVLAHVAELAERELAGEPTGSVETDGGLAGAIRAGDQDGELLELAGRLRSGVCGRLTVASPGYDRSPEPPE